MEFISRVFPLNIMEKSEILEILSSLENPYPEDIFPSVKATTLNFQNRRDAMFGSFGRRVFDNTIDKIREAVTDSD